MKTLTIVALMFLVSSCSVMFHYPSSPNIPVMDTTNILSFEGCLTTLGSDVKANFRLPGNTVLQAAMHRRMSGNNYNEMETYKEAALGYVHQFHDWNISIIGGYGKGYSDFDLDDKGDSFDLYGNAKYNKYFVQSAISQGNRKNQFGLVIKVSYIDYFITDLHGSYSQRSVREGKYYPSSTIEPTLYYRRNIHDLAMLTVYIGKYSFQSDIGVNELKAVPPLIGVGLGLILDKKLFK